MSETTTVTKKSDASSGVGVPRARIIDVPEYDMEKQQARIAKNPPPPPKQKFEMKPLLPKWEYIVMVKEKLGILLILFASIGIICGATLDARKRSTILATQYPQDDQIVGMVTMTPESHTVLVITPLLSISIPNLIIGLWIVASMRIKWLKDLYVVEIQAKYMARLAYYQATIQSTVIVLTVMPLAGVINAYELATLSALTWAEFLMYLHSDLANMLVFNKWELVDSVVDSENHRPEVLLSTVAPQQVPNFQFTYEQLIGGIAMHTFVYIIMTIHIIQSMSSPNYDTNAWYNTIVFLTMALQYLIPLFKFLQMARVHYLKFFSVYKMVVLCIEVVEVINTVLIIVMLIFAIAF